MESKGSDVTCSLAAAVYRHGRDTPQALAVASEGRSLTYGQLAGHAARLARRLAAAPGWPAGDARRSGAGAPRVGILASRSVDACIAVVGAAWAGATYVPLGLRLPDERLLTILSVCGLAAIVADAKGIARLNQRILQAAPGCVLALGERSFGGGAGDAGGRIDWLDTASLDTASLDTSSGGHAPARFLPGTSCRSDASVTGTPLPTGDELAAPAPMAGGDTAYIIFTSGTTGTPKGVMIPLLAARHYIDTMTRKLGLRSSDRVLESCELTFDFSVHNMFTTWESGASLHVLPASRAMGAVRFARVNGLTVWNSVPSLAGLLRQVKALAPGALSGLRLTVFGGEQLSQGTVQAWRSAAPTTAIWNLYGPTEATVYCLAQPVIGTASHSPGKDAIAIGTALPGNEAAVLDAHRKPVAAGQAGELAITGVQLAAGYLRAPEQTAARFPTLAGRRWYLTGDLATCDEAGIFHWLGRLDNQVKLLGHRVELEEVDAHLRIVADADLVGTIAWPLSDAGAQGLVAFVAGNAIDEAGIIAALRQRLPPYMIPARVVLLAAMPLNANGKVDRQALRQRLEQEAA